MSLQSKQSEQGGQREQSAVTVIGLGPMGRALAGAFLDAGLRTTVWNRTPGRDRELVGRGAVSAPSAEEAVAASGLIVVCVVNYDAVDAILRRDAVAGALKGRTVVNLTADTPGRARDAAAWADGHGVRYLDGAIMTPTVTIGTPEAVLLYSGPEELYREHRSVLDALGGTHTHLGEKICRAAAYDIALLDIFWTAMSGYHHALAVARAEGITARGSGALRRRYRCHPSRDLRRGRGGGGRGHVLRRGQSAHLGGFHHGPRRPPLRGPWHRRGHRARGRGDRPAGHRARSWGGRAPPGRRAAGAEER